MTDLHLDTHVVVWLFAGEHDRLPTDLRRRLADTPLRVSPMVRLELAYLHEIGRLTVPASPILAELERSIGLAEDTTPFATVASAAEAQTWTRDPFDRVIAAQSLVAFATLVTRDQRIRKALGQHAIWD